MCMRSFVESNILELPLSPQQHKYDICCSIPVGGILVDHNLQISLLYRYMGIVTELEHTAFSCTNRTQLKTRINR